MRDLYELLKNPLFIGEAFYSQLGFVTIAVE
jgi:hypothetical protein